MEVALYYDFTIRSTGFCHPEREPVRNPLSEIHTDHEYIPNSSVDKLNSWKAYRQGVLL